MISDRKFVETKKILDWEVLSDKGYTNIEYIGKTINYTKWIIKTFNGLTLECADNHIIFDSIGREVFVKDIEVGRLIDTENGIDEIISITKSDEDIPMYDLQLSDGDRRYYTNSILSHNSLWMQNFAVKTADLGYNVLYITLEMSVKKCLKRTGAMRLRIPINDYDEVSRNPEFIKSKISELHKFKTDDLFESHIGKLITKFYAAGTATVSDFDRLINSIQQKKGIKIHMLVVDYITLIAAPKGIAGDNLYQKGKHLAEALRAVGAKYNMPVITGIQVAKDAWGASDITLESIPESKAIAETADSFFAIIRTPEMQRMNKYRLKLLKQRDGDLTRTQLMFDLNITYLTIENDNFIENT